MIKNNCYTLESLGLKENPVLLGICAVRVLIYENVREN